MTTDAPALRERLFHVRPVFRRRYRFTGGLLETGPWIDVVLLAFLFFITIGATLQKPGLRISLPVAEATGGARYDAHVLSVPRDQVYYFADQRVGRMTLADRLRDAAAASPGATLIIEADGAIAHRDITELYAIAANAGWSNILLATRQP